MTKKAKKTLTIPLTEYEQPPLVLGMVMLSLGEEDDAAHGRVVTTAGCGGDGILLEWRGRAAIVRGRDLIRAWVSTWAPDDAARMP